MSFALKVMIILCITAICILAVAGYAAAEHGFDIRAGGLAVIGLILLAVTSIEIFEHRRIYNRDNR